jgi:hypothetical protein
VKTKIPVGVDEFGDGFEPIPYFRDKFSFGKFWFFLLPD